MKVMLVPSFLLLALPIVSAIGGPPVEYRTLEEIYDSAKKELGTLKVSWGGDEQRAGDGIRAAFGIRFPDIKLNLTVDLSKYHDSRADRAWITSDGTSDGVDIAVIQTHHDFPRWKRDGRLMPYKVRDWASIYPSFKDWEGYYTDGFGSIIYNNKTISAEKVPDNYGEFIKPEWKGKLVLTPPNDDDAIAFLFTQIIDKYGWGWLEALANQNVTWVRGSASPATLLTAPNSKFMASFTTSNRSGAIVSSKEPTDPYMSWPQNGAIFASTKMPETARLFMSYIMSDEWQQPLANQGLSVTRNNLLTVPGGGVFEKKLTEPLAFTKWMINRENVEWWRLQYETTLGTAQGISPLQDNI